jgi:hypothetical protein
MTYDEPEPGEEVVVLNSYLIKAVYTLRSSKNS